MIIISRILVIKMEKRSYLRLSQWALKNRAAIRSVMISDDIMANHHDCTLVIV